MIKTINLINNYFLTKTEKRMIIYLFFFSLIIPFLELLSVATLGALILVFIDFENFIKIIPSLTLKEQLLNIDRILLLKILSFLVLIALIAKNLIIFFYFFFEKKIERYLILNHSKILIRSYLNLSYKKHTSLNSENIQNDILYQSKKIASFIFFTIGFLKDLFISIFFVASLFFVNLKASIIVIFFTIIIGSIFQLLSRKEIKAAGIKVRLLDALQIKMVSALVTGIKTVTIYHKKNFFFEKISSIIQNKLTTELFYHIIQKVPRLLIESAFVVLIVGYLMYMANDLNSLKEILPFFVFLSLISVRLIPIFSTINSTIANLKYLQPSVNSLSNQLKDENREIIYTQNNKSFDDIKLRSIELKDVSYSYDKSRLIANKINLKFNSNKIYCLVGETGSGKSTLVDIIMGLLKPMEGKILVNDDIELNSSNSKNFFQNISYVPQETFLINDTIKNNIFFADKDDNFNKEQFDSTIKLSLLEDLLKKSEEISEFIIGDRGVRISGGERQRIGLARAFYRNKQVFTFDEATSALDFNTEKEIFKNLHKIKQNKIIIIIAHRDSAIKLSDEIISLDDGRVNFIGVAKDYFEFRFYNNKT